MSEAIIAVARAIHDINIDMRERDILPMWTVYAKPKDFPDGFIARCFETCGGPPDPVPTGYVITGPLDLIRESMQRCGMHCMTRNEGDDPVVVETWL